MKNSDIEILSKVAYALEKYLPETESALCKDYLTVYEALKSKNEKEKRYYQEKAEYHRNFTKKWREDNPGKQDEYQRKYKKKKRHESELINIDFEHPLPLTSPSHLFVGKKPVSVMFGTESIEVKSWREVYTVIIGRCNENPYNHETLMSLRNKAAGKVRKFLSDKPDGMSKPYRIDEDLWGEVHYGSAMLMHILVNQILAYVDFDCYGVSLVLKARDK